MGSAGDCTPAGRKRNGRDCPVMLLAIYARKSTDRTGVADEGTRKRMD
jgi:hypothetical protein